MLANSSLFWLVLIGGLAALYVLPSVVAAFRHVEGLGWIIVLNLLPTGVGWFAALLLACMMPRRRPQPPRYYYFTEPCKRLATSGCFCDLPEQHRARSAAWPASNMRLSSRNMHDCGR